MHFKSAEVLRLLEASDDAAFRDLLITAGFLTGARYGELTACLQVRHFDQDGEALRVPSGKTGARTIILEPESRRIFRTLGRPSFER